MKVTHGYGISPINNRRVIIVVARILIDMFDDIEVNAGNETEREAGIA